MLARITLLAGIFSISLGVGAQCRMVSVSENGGTASGKSCKRSSSSTYGGKIEVEVRAGEWTFLNEDGVIFKKGEYRELDGGSIKYGDWQWLDENGKCFLKLKYENDKPAKIIALDSGIALNGDDSACVYKPDSLHYIIRFSLKGQHKGWTVDALGNWLDYNAKATKKTYKPVVGVIGKNEESPDAKGLEKPRENIRWSDGEMLEMFTPLKKLAVSPMGATGGNENLILNPGFLSKGKPLKDGIYVLNTGYIENWKSAELTPDIYTVDGITILGFRWYGQNFEIIRASLKKPLVQGQFYCFSVRIKLRSQCIYALNNMGALISEKPDYRSNNGSVPENTEGIFLYSQSNIPVCMRDSWMTIEGRFKAKGNEKYVYFGHFSVAENIHAWPLDSIYSGGGVSNAGEIYYYIQNPVLIEAEKEDMCICNLQDCPEPEEKVEAPVVQVDSFVLTAVQFSTAKWDLLETAFDALDSLANYLTDYESYTLQIVGHTDNQGKPKDNQLLSEKRAKAVMKYLESKGVNSKRMAYSGMGDSDPIDENESEEGRERNRRVEFKITKNPPID